MTNRVLLGNRTVGASQVIGNEIAVVLVEAHDDRVADAHVREPQVLVVVRHCAGGTRPGTNLKGPGSISSLDGNGLVLSVHRRHLSVEHHVTAGIVSGMSSGPGAGSRGAAQRRITQPIARVSPPGWRV